MIYAWSLYQCSSKLVRDFDLMQFKLVKKFIHTSTPIKVDVTGHIDAVDDGVTIAPTLTFGDAFSWVSLNLNANMKDTDGSEVMSLEIGWIRWIYNLDIDGTVISGAIGMETGL